MFGDSHNEQNSVGLAESRACTRVQVHSLAYIELSDENAGLILNISETGVAVQAVQVLTSDQFARMRFRLPRTDSLIETAGRMVWQVRSKKEAGIEFLGLTEKARAQIRSWISAEQTRMGAPPQEAWRQPRQDDLPPFPLMEEKGGSAHGATASRRTEILRQPAAEPEPPLPASAAKGLGDSLSQIDSRTPALAAPSERVLGRDRRSRFHLPPMDSGVAPAARLEEQPTPERISAMPRSSWGIAPGMGMEFERPRRWWAYTAVFGFIAALGFAILMMFNPDAITRARIGALTHEVRTVAGGNRPSGRDNNANQPQQSAQPAENSQLRSGVPLPYSSDGGTKATEVQPSTSAPDTNASAPDIEGSDNSEADAQASNRAAAKQSSHATGGTKSKRYGTAAPEANPAEGTRYPYRNPYQNPVRGNTQEIERPQKRTPQNSPATPGKAAPYDQTGTSSYGSPAIAANQPRTESTESRNGGAISPAGSNASGVAQQKSPANSSASQPTTTQGFRPQAQAGNSVANSTVQPSPPGRPAQERIPSPLDTFRAQTEQPTTSNSAGNPSASDAASRQQELAAGQDQDAYARRPANSTTNSSNAPRVASSQRPVSSVEMRGSTSPVPPSVPLSGVPSGSVGATSQFHGFRIPAELQAQGAQPSGHLQIGQLLSSYSPAYPVGAARQGIEGTVKLDVVVGRDGSVRSVQVLSGPAMLTGAAVNAVRDWRYGETFLEGQPIEAQQYVTVVFRLAAKSSQK
jgi:TonB family protein